VVPTTQNFVSCDSSRQTPTLFTNNTYKIKTMMYTSALLYISLSYMVAAEPANRSLRGGKAAKKAVKTPVVVPLSVVDAIKISPSDEHDSGITLSTNTFASGDPISVMFEVLPSYLADANLEVDTTRLSDWRVGIFMHMANPQNGDLEPIVSLTPTIESKKNRGISLNLEGGVTFSSDVMAVMGGSDPEWPISIVEYGTGFDVWLLNENGAGVLGPEWFTLEPTEEMLEIQQYDEANTLTHELEIYGHGDIKQDFTVDKNDALAASSHSDFVLETDKQVYSSDERIQVSYTIGHSVSNDIFVENEVIRFEADHTANDALEFGQELPFAQVSGINDPFGQDFETNESADPKYTIGVWMKMARPQGGELEPIISIEVDTKEGKVTFDTAQLDTTMYGTGFDVWIVDEHGSEVYGPITFSIPDPEE
jgi:hypothetical protein